MFINIHSGHNSKRILLLMILMLALVARFRYLTEIEHNVDHAYPVWQAMQTIDAGVFPLAGQGTSVLFANPALTGYLFIPVVALTRSPLGVYIFVIALNTLAVWMAYRAARSVMGEWSAWGGAALMAVNPWVIEYSRTSWVQSLLPFFVCGVAWLLWPVLMGHSRNPTRRLALALIMTALLTQTYLLAYFILLPVAVLLVIFRRRVPMRGLLIGGGVIIGVTVLYGMGLLGQMETVQQRLNDFSSGESRLNTQALEGAIRLVTGWEYEVARGMQAPADDATLRQTLSQPFHLVLLIVIGLGVVRLFTRLRQPGTARDAAMIVLVWFGLPILAMSYTGNPVHPFYQLLGLPAGYVVAMWGIDWICHIETSPIGRWVVLVLFIPFAALSLTNSARYYQETQAKPGAHGLTALPVDYGLQLGQGINRFTDNNGVVFAPVEGWILNSFAGRLFPTIEDNRAPRFSIFPASGGAYVSFDWDDVPDVPYANDTDVIALADGALLRVAAMPTATEVEANGQVLNIPTQQGLTLLSYDLTRAGEQFRIETQWRVDSILPEVLDRIYAPFIHVLDSEGQVVTIIDGEGLPGYRWTVGDVHVHRMTFPLPQDVSAPFTLVVGQFDGLNNANLIFLPPDGEPDVIVHLPEQLP